MQPQKLPATGSIQWCGCCLNLQLQCALERAGCYCGEDEMMWWQFGMATESALRTFQVGRAPNMQPAHALTSSPAHAPQAAGVHIRLLTPRGVPSQGINGLPETGVSDAGTWQVLLGEAAQPADLVNLSANNAQYDDDMSGHSDSVWLLVRI